MNHIPALMGILFMGPDPSRSYSPAVVWGFGGSGLSICFAV